MNIVQQLKVIESEAVPKEGATIETNSTSITITHTCGCILVDHFAAKIPTRSSYHSSRVYDFICKSAKYYVELCPEHTPLATEQVEFEIEKYIQKKKK